MTLRRTPLHRSVLRSQMMFGAEREPALVAALISALVGFSGYLGGNLMVFVSALPLWMLLIWGLRTLAKSDNQMKAVYLRHVKYLPYYTARSTPWRKD